MGVLALTAAACGSSKKAATAPSGSATTARRAAASAAHVKIGFFGALTGPNAQLGINEYDATQLAVDQYNKKGGTQVDLIKYDSQGDPAQAPQLAQKAITDKIVAVVGPAFSGESKAADPIFEQAGIVNVTAVGHQPDAGQQRLEVLAPGRRQRQLPGPGARPTTSRRSSRPRTSPSSTTTRSTASASPTSSAAP